MLRRSMLAVMIIRVRFSNHCDLLYYGTVATQSLFASQYRVCGKHITKVKILHKLSSETYRDVGFES